MIRDEDVDWIALLEVGWHGTTLDDALGDLCWILPFLEHWADSPFRLYCKGRVLGHKRAKRNTRPNTSLIQIEGVATKEDAQFYLGKVRDYHKDILSFFPIDKSACCLRLQSKN